MPVLLKTNSDSPPEPGRNRSFALATKSNRKFALSVWTAMEAGSTNVENPHFCRALFQIEAGFL